MDDTVIMRRRVHSNFTTYTNEVIRDDRISWKALGILVFLLSFPDNFRFRLSHLSKQKSVHSGRDATRSGLKELQQAGYLHIERVRTEGGKFAHVQWLVTDRPGDWALEPPCSDFPNAVNPTADNPESENPTLINIDSNKN